MSSEVKGLRYNEGKLPYHLISPLAKRELARVLQEGAKKYAERNWENGLVWMECMSSLERHLEKWKLGEEYDPETGCLHMAHVFTNAMFLLHFQLTGTGKDDRPNYKEVIDATKLEGGPPSTGWHAEYERWLDSVESGRLPDDEEDVREEAST